MGPGIEIQKARCQNSGVVAAGRNSSPDRYPTTNARYDTSRDDTRNRSANANEGLPAPISANNVQTPVDRLPPAVGTPAARDSEGYELIRQGEQALTRSRYHSCPGTISRGEWFRGELDPMAAQRLQDRLQMLSVPSARQLPSGGQAELIDSATAKQQLALKQLSAEVTRQPMVARQLMEVKPREALDVLKQAKLTVEESTVDPEFRATLGKRLDVTFAEVEKYMEKNRAQLELDERNREALNDVRRRRSGKVEVDERIAKFVDEFDKLMDEQRFPEAEILAKRANGLERLKNPIVQQLMWVSKFARATFNNQTIQEARQSGAMAEWTSIDEAAVPFDDREPIRFPDARKWDKYTKSRQQRFAEARGRHSEKELQIERKLRTPVSANFRDRPWQKC